MYTSNLYFSVCTYMYDQFISKAANVDAICATLPRVAAARCPDMDDIVESVANKYGRALLLYSKCHQAFNSSRTFRDEELTSLRK